MVNLLLAVIYLAFISLGLPDGLLGAGWPVMYTELSVPLSYAGFVSMIIAFGTVVSSLMSDRLTRRLGTGRVTAISVATTAAALFGFSISHSYWQLLLWAIPYGLGAGSVDASLNNYVALHYESRHMSWLHCMWGIGASTGPYVMGFVLTKGLSWNAGYLSVAGIQIVLTVLLFFSLPLWKGREEGLSEELMGARTEEKRKNVSEEQGASEGNDAYGAGRPLSLLEIVRLAGAKEVMICFFCYSVIEQTAGLWAASYLNLSKGVDEKTAAFFASLVYLGITVGRAISGFVTMKLSDEQMIRLGEGIILAGVVMMLLPFGKSAALVGLVLVGLGCAPIYPCIIHSTPAHFGADRSQAIIGVQMASAYIGTTLMPPLFGVIANSIGVSVFPVYLGIALILMAFMHEKLILRTK